MQIKRAEKRRKDQEAVQRLRTAQRASQITMYRAYRSGELPDINIKHREVGPDLYEQGGRALFRTHRPMCFLVASLCRLRSSCRCRVLCKRTLRLLDKCSAVCLFLR